MGPAFLVMHLDSHGIVHLVKVTEKIKRAIGLAFGNLGLNFTTAHVAAIRFRESPGIVIRLLLGKGGAVESQKGQVGNFREVAGVRENGEQGR